jgi:hypothetical protein
MGILSLLAGLKPHQCRPGWPHGLHGEVIYGLGGMDDASLCLRCGLDTYGRVWPRESIREVRAPEDWPAIEEARRKGIENN